MFLLSETSKEYKERAVMFYRFFKIFFAEKEKEFQEKIFRNHERIKFIKNLCKQILKSNNKYVANMEEISDIIFRNKLSQENLAKHKELINNLLSVINEKREEHYLLQSKIDISEKELRTWVYDIDKIKILPAMQERLKNINLKEIVDNIYNELAHRK